MKLKNNDCIELETPEGTIFVSIDSVGVATIEIDGMIANVYENGEALS